MKFSLLLENEKDEYLRLINQNYHTGQVSDEYWKSFFEEYDESGASLIYLVRIYSKEQEKDIVIGTVTLNIENKIYLTGPIIRIEDLIVEEKMRNLGLGTKIVKEVLNIAEGLSASILTVGCGNKRLLNFFNEILGEKDCGCGFTLNKWVLS